MLRGADSGRVFWTRPAGSAIKLSGRPTAVGCSSFTRRDARVLSASGHTETTIKLGTANPLVSGSLSPNGEKVALVRRQGVQVAHLTSGRAATGAALASVLPGAGIQK